MNRSVPQDVPADTETPSIVLVSQGHADALLDEFGRYRRDYDLHAAGTAIEAITVLSRWRSKERPVALIVIESVLPDMNVL